MKRAFICPETDSVYRIDSAWSVITDDATWDQQAVDAANHLSEVNDAMRIAGVEMDETKDRFEGWKSSYMDRETANNPKDSKWKVEGKMSKEEQYQLYSRQISTLARDLQWLGRLRDDLIKKTELCQMLFHGEKKGLTTVANNSL